MKPLKIERDTTANNQKTSVVGQIDLAFEDIISQLVTIINEEDKDQKELYLNKLYDYVRGYQDGLRFNRTKPESIEIDMNPDMGYNHHKYQELIQYMNKDVYVTLGNGDNFIDTVIDMSLKTITFKGHGKIPITTSLSLFCQPYPPGDE